MENEMAMNDNQDAYRIYVTPVSMALAYLPKGLLINLGRLAGFGQMNIVVWTSALFVLSRHRFAVNYGDLSSLCHGFRIP